MCYVFSGIDMKKDIEVLIAEERAQIICKYDKVRNRSLVILFTWINAITRCVLFLFWFFFVYVYLQEKELHFQSV